MDPNTAPDSRLKLERIHSMYDSMSRFYDMWGVNMEGRARKRGVELAGIQDGECFLDVGTGTGLILAEIAGCNPHGYNVGIDISEGMLGKAREKLAKANIRAELKASHASSLPYPDHTFDLLTSGYLFDLMRFEDMPVVLAEFRRVLKPGGRLVMINMTIGERFGSRIYQGIYRLSPALMGGCRGVKLAGFLEKAGFQVVTREYHQQLLFPSEVLLAKVNS